jgi:hypothetical protein
MCFFSSMPADDSAAGDVPNEVTLKIFATRDEAALAVAQLEANGIACRIAADDCAGMLPNLSQAQGVRVLVAAPLAAAARELLDLPPAPVSETVSAGTPEIATRFKISFGQILFGIVLGALATWALQGGVPAKPAGPRTTHYHYADNGMKDEEWLYKNGRLVCHMVDRNLDGSFDQWTYFDADGYVERSEHDNNFDGKPDEFWTYSDNELVAMEKDADFNGVPDEFFTYKFSIPSQLDIKPNGSTFTTLREFLSNGVLTEVWSGGDSNGNFKKKVTYDPFLNPIHTNFPFQSLLSVP